MMVRPPRARRALLAALALFGAACAPDTATGPGEIAWDRDVCEHCQMIISERRYAAQVRDADRKRLHRFDDLGCALLWLAGHPSADAGNAELWVLDPGSGDWIDGRAAHYTVGHRTPMGYGFAPAAGRPPDSLDLAEVRRRILAGTDERRHAGD
jgi:nitrous oxide reductase accessory protein NosL